mgnify:CR=1 FL=1
MTIMSPAANDDLGRPPANFSLDLVSGIAGLIAAAGYLIDAWSHAHFLISSETYFTPTHGFLYGGFIAIGIFTTLSAARNHARGYPWRCALPRAYDLTVVGLAILIVGALPDYLWHLLYGIEESLDILFSPTHILLGIGTAFVVLGPLRSALEARPRPATLIAQLPALLSCAALVLLMMFFTQYVFNPGIERAMTPVGMSRFGSDFEGTAFTYFRQSLAILIIFAHAALIGGFSLFAIKQFSLRFGFLTLMLGISWAIVSALLLNSSSAWLTNAGSAVIAGLAGDALVLWLRPGSVRIAEFRWFAFAVPATFAAVLLILTATIMGGTWFDRNIAIGTVLFSGAIGLFESYLSLPASATPDIG